MVNYKALGNDQHAWHGGTGKWAKGRWRTVTGDLVPCENGLHYCRPDQIVKWLGPSLWLFEDGSPDETIDAGDKMVTRKGRIVQRVGAWNERNARLFAADCAERVLHLFEAKYPEDDRPRRAIAAARQFANGEIGAAARDAAWAAARDAAGDAARAAAWDAARAAARAAAGAAAGAAARDGEREWQTAKLTEYLEAPR